MFRICIWAFHLAKVALPHLQLRINERLTVAEGLVALSSWWAQFERRVLRESFSLPEKDRDQGPQNSKMGKK